MTKTSSLKKFSIPVICGIIAYGIHKIADAAIIGENCGAPWFLEFTYIFFLVFTMAIISGLSKVQRSNIDYVGYSFLLLTCIKMAAAYAFFNLGISEDVSGRQICKMNFFIVFIIFLAVETYSTIKMLNQK